jgi:dTDP-4-amino-4,6-dideoxygalactose transaminase
LPDFSQERNYDVYSSYCVRVNRRDALFEYLRKEGIEVFIHWPTPIHLQKDLRLAKFKLPQTEEVSKTVLSLPIYPELTDSQMEFVINAVKKFFKK